MLNYRIQNIWNVTRKIYEGSVTKNNPDNTKIIATTNMESELPR